MLPSKEELVELYQNQLKTMSEIGNIFSIERHTVSKMLQEFDIKIRDFRSNCSIPPKEDLIRLYDNEMKTIPEICEIYGVGKKAVNRWFESYDIRKTTNAQKKYHKTRKVPISQEQRSVIIGTILGDAHMSQSGKFKRIGVSHCKKQLSYLAWKKEILKDLVPNKIREHPVDRWGSYMFSIVTVGHQDFNPIHKLFYDNNKKVIKPELAYYLDVLALAIWFMDDGSSKKNKYGITYCSKFSTEGFGYKENETLQHILLTNFGIKSKVCQYKRYDKQYNYLSVNKKNSIKLTQIIEKYVVPCMRYKLVYDCSSETTCQAPQNRVMI